MTPDIKELVERALDTARLTRNDSFNDSGLLTELAKALTSLSEQNERMRIEFMECAEYDAMMEGPRFKGWNRSALDRLRREYEARAALSKDTPNDQN